MYIKNTRLEKKRKEKKVSDMFKRLTLKLEMKSKHKVFYTYYESNTFWEINDKVNKLFLNALLVPPPEM